MTRMQQHVDRSKHNLNSLFEEVISSVEKDCTFKPSLEPTRAVSRSRSSNMASPCPGDRVQCSQFTGERGAAAEKGFISRL